MLARSLVVGFLPVPLPASLPCLPAPGNKERTACNHVIQSDNSKFLEKSKNSFTNMRSIRCLSPSSTQKIHYTILLLAINCQITYIFSELINFYNTRFGLCRFFLHYTIRLLSCKYEPLTQGNGLNPNHDGSSMERDVPNDVCVLRNKPLSRERKQHAWFFYSCKHGRRRSGCARR